MSTAKNIVFSFITIVLFIGLIEGVGHTIYYFTHDKMTMAENRSLSSTIEFSPFALWKHSPNIKYRLWHYPGHLSTDRYGFIHNGFDQEIKEDDYLIFLLGGSTVEGLGATSNEHTIAANLERILNEKSEEQAFDTNFRVMNTGYSGYMSYQQLNFLEGEILPHFSPNLVISLDGRNDAYYVAAFADYGWHENWSPAYENVRTNVQNLIQDVSFLRSTSRYLYLNSITLATIKRVMKKYLKITFPNKNESFLQDKPISQAHIERAGKAYTDNQFMMKRRCELNDVAYIGVLQPTLSTLQKPQMTDYEMRRYDQFINGEAGKNPSYIDDVEAVYKDIRQRLKNYAWFYDGSDLFVNEAGGMYYDSVHYSDEGSEKVAAYISKQIEPIIKKHIG